MKIIHIKGLTLRPTDFMTREEWLEFRQLGMGGSDMGTMLGVNKRQSPTELFYQKCGLGMSSDEVNNAMFWGTQLEDVILDKAQYLNLEDQTYIPAFLEKRKLRTISKFRYMVQNEKYPWLIGNLDGLINYNGRHKIADKIAEAKAISRQSAEMWETIPIYHLFQLQAYITICEPILREQSSNIYYLEDGRELSGWEIPIVADLRDHMIEESYKFWQLVLKGREIVANEPDMDKRLQYMTEYEPALVGTEAYYEFLSKVYQLKSKFIQIKGTKKDLSLATKYKALGAKSKMYKERQQLQKNIIMKRLNDSAANIIDLPDGGKISFNKKLYINIK